MNLRSFVFLWTAFFLFGGGGKAEDAESPVRETAEVVLVEVPVRVVDRAGHPIRNLSENDFELYDDGRRQPILGFDVIDLAEKGLGPAAGEGIHPAARRHFLILFDLSFARPKAILAARRAAKEFVLSGMGDRDFAAVATYSVERGLKLLVTFSGDRGQLARAIDTLGISASGEVTGDPLAFAFDLSNLVMGASVTRGQGRSEAAAAEMIETLQTMASLTRARSDEYARDRVRQLIQSFSQLAGALDAVAGRKDIIYLSEGFASRLLVGTRHNEQEQEWLLRGETWKVDSDKRFGNSPLRANLDGMTALFRRSDCVVHAVDIGGIRAETDSGAQSDTSFWGPKETENSLFELASGTGGEVFRNDNDLAAQLQALVTRTSLVYVLAFRPEKTGKEGTFHELKVKVKARGARVSARAGYYEKKGFKLFSPLERSLSAADVIANEIAVSDIPARVLAIPFPQEEAGRIRAVVPVLVEIPGDRFLARQSGDRTAAELYVYASDSENRLQDFFVQSVGIDLAANSEKLRKAGLKYAGQISLPPGDYRLRVLVRNSETGRAGLTVQSLHVPTFAAGQPYLVSPIFLEPANGGILLRGRPGTRAGGAASDDPLLRAAAQDFVPAALPSLRAGSPSPVSVVAYHFGLEDGEATLKMGAQVLSEEGRPLGEGAISLVGRSPVEADGRQVLHVSFTPANLSPGRYALRVILQESATGRGSHASAPFLVR
jgi:VWFA-related protein